MSEEKQVSIAAVVHKMIIKIEAMKKTNDAAALLAALRNSVAKPLEEAKDVWPFLFENLPESYLSHDGRITKEESTIFTVLQLYAICMQGAASQVHADETYKGSIGSSLKAGRAGEDTKALDRRFNVLIASDSFDELSYHLRQIVKLVKSKTVITVNFSKLAQDLFWFQCGHSQQICFQWATDYYYVNTKQEETLNQ